MIIRKNRHVDLDLMWWTGARETYRRQAVRALCGDV
jgi:hypothetical protein